MSDGNMGRSKEGELMAIRRSPLISTVSLAPFVDSFSFSFLVAVMPLKASAAWKGKAEEADLAANLASFLWRQYSSESFLFLNIAIGKHFFCSKT
jgi:hypothetical protein